MKKRIQYIDFLRFIGLSLVILAHVIAPNTLVQLRSFDVCLMVFLSGLSYGAKEPNYKYSLRGFYLPRVKRLLVPTYIFLTLFFLGFFIIGHEWSFSYIYKSYLLFYDGSIGFVWIIKVFLLITICTPLVVQLGKLRNVTFLVVFILLFTFNECVCMCHTGNIYFNETAPYLTGYLLPFMWGFKIRQLNKRTEKIGVGIVLCTFIVALLIYLYFNGTSFLISPNYKYPPHSYYIIYGIFASTILWYLRRYFETIKIHDFFLFIGKNAIWIYLWHIPYVMLFNAIWGSWILKFIVIYVCAILTFTVQYRIVSIVEGRGIHCDFFKYFKG